MSLRRFVFAGSVLGALLGLPAPSGAGPIDFSYHTTRNVFTHPSRYDPGPLDFALDAGGNVGWTERGGSIELGAVRLGASPGPRAADSYTAYADFEVAVAVTDQMTGESIDLVLRGAAVDMWDYRAWDGRWTNSYHRLDLGDSFAGNAAETSAVLGLVRYTLAVRPADDHQTGAYTLAATVTNPEPGALALALTALAPLAARVTRRTAR